MEQNVDIPVPGRGGRNVSLQGFLPEQSSTALHVSQEPAEKMPTVLTLSSLHLPKQSSTAAGAEQSVDIPVRGGLMTEFDAAYCGTAR